MSRNGNGTYSLPAGNPVVTGTTISSSWANTTLNDVANALTGSVAADGQTPITGNLNLNNNKITNLATPTNAQDAATKTYVDAIIPSQTGNNGKYLTTDGSVLSWGTVVSPIPSGTLMLFQQTSAPTGWTKQTTHNDKALRVVSGAASSGGTTAFSTVFTNQTPTITTSGLSVGATTLSTSQIPSHSHAENGGNNSAAYVADGGCFYAISMTPAASASTRINTDATGGGGSHTHSMSGSATSSAITLNVQYVDLIIASKD